MVIQVSGDYLKELDFDIGNWEAGSELVLPIDRSGVQFPATLNEAGDGYDLPPKDTWNRFKIISRNYASGMFTLEFIGKSGGQ